VFIHEFFPGRETVADAELVPLVAAALDKRSPREWYYALMDYGAALARRVPNPNRRSRSWTRQGRFEGSDRQIRGEVLRRLLDGGPAAPAAFAARIAKSLGTEALRVRRLLADLEREGFVQRDGRRVLIAGHESREGRALA
jgi:A/G-specific adenine glycosylase